jgi:hypothetical protein
VRRVLALLALAVMLPAAPAGAARTLTGVRDVRYCEILELRGMPPDAAVTVWNTIGLNRCPPSLWRFDAAGLADELGAAAVILNGPRHWLMDSITGRTGRTRAFHGLRMRRVARIPIRSTADLTRAPYTDRVIERTNVWRWKAGRRVFELVAPGGDVYVMQSYAQIVDRGLRLRDLRRLGRRLDLPDGWRYRTRVLKEPLALGARGSATILQDDLQDTYQLASRTRRGARRAHDVRLSGTTRSVPTDGPPGTVEDHGTVSGTPFGDGTVVLRGMLADGRLTAVVRLTFARGSVLGRVSMPYEISADGISFAGSTTLTGGTGAYRGIRGTLATTDHNTLDGQHGTLSVKGSATY